MGGYQRTPKRLFCNWLMLYEEAVEKPSCKGYDWRRVCEETAGKGEEGSEREREEERGGETGRGDE